MRVCKRNTYNGFIGLNIFHLPATVFSFTVNLHAGRLWFALRGKQNSKHSEAEGKLSHPSVIQTNRFTMVNSIQGRGNYFSNMLICKILQPG